MLRRPLVAAAALVLAGCTLHADNPSFQLSRSDARNDLKRMEDQPVTLQRPVIVVGGYLDPGIGTCRVSHIVRQCTGDQRVIGVNLPVWYDMAALRHRLVEAVQKAYPSDDPRQTIDVDVIGLSMGGLVARDAAIPREGEPRLQVVRLFTIGTPHAGAQLACLPTLTPQHVAMRRNSDYLKMLDDALPNAGFELIPYGRLGDVVVGVTNTAPPGRAPFWLGRSPFEIGHFGSFTDARIDADILRRLRGEEPWTHEPPTPLPRD